MAEAARLEIGAPCRAEIDRRVECTLLHGDIQIRWMVVLATQYCSFFKGGTKICVLRLVTSRLWDNRLFFDIGAILFEPKQGGIKFASILGQLDRVVIIM